MAMRAATVALSEEARVAFVAEVVPRWVSDEVRARMLAVLKR